MQENLSTFCDQYKLLGMPSEILEILFSFIPFRESYNFRVSHRQILSAFLSYFRRSFREHLQIFNEHLIDKFELIDCDEEYREKYQVEFEKVENELNCKIPFMLKELLMMTKHFGEEGNNAIATSYPVHWFNPIKSWTKEGNFVRVSSGSDGIFLVGNGKYNNILIRLAYNSVVRFFDLLFKPHTGIFKIEGHSFSKQKFSFKLQVQTNLVNVLSNVTSIPLAIGLLNHFALIDVSPRILNKVVAIISPSLYSNKDFLYKAVKIHVKIAKQIPQRLFDDRGFCLGLVRSHGKTLKYCTKFLQDKQVVTQALKQNGFAIKYLSSHYLRSNQDLLDIAITSKPFSLNYVPNSASNFKQLVIKALDGITELISIPEFINDDYLQDKELVEIILNKNPKLISLMPPIWRECRPLARKLFSIDPSSIFGFSSKLLTDDRIFKMIVEVKPTLLCHWIQNTEQAVKKALKIWGLPPFTNGNDKKVMKEILALARKNPDIYSLMLGLPNFGHNCGDLLKFIFVKEGISHNSELIQHERVREIISKLGIEQQEEILNILISNAKPLGSCFFACFERDLLESYNAKAYLRGMKLYEGGSVVIRADDIVEFFKYQPDFANVTFV